jgi:hypothetical protein
MKTKISILMLSLMLSTALVNSAEAQRYRPHYRHCMPHVGIVIAPSPVVVQGPGFYAPYRPQRVWVEGHWRYNRYGQARWVAAHWKMV